MEFFIITYIIAGVWWGMFAADRHAFLYPSDTKTTKLLLVFAINAVIWPVGLPLGYFKLLKGK